MSQILTSLLAFVVAIGLLVAIHEYGHYIVARALGVKVLRYSIGFGRVLWSRRSGADQTEYCLSAIPLGGYVKLLDERDCAVTFAERGRAFNRQSAGARIAILAAGPAFNLLFAIVAYTVMFVSGVPGHEARRWPGRGRIPGGRGRACARATRSSPSATGACSTWEARHARHARRHAGGWRDPPGRCRWRGR